MSARGRRPGQLAHGQPESVGGGQNDLLAGDLDADAGQHRQRVIPAGRDRDLTDRLGEQIRGHHTGLLGQRRQRRVVLDRHGRQRESGATAAQRHPGALDADVHRLGRQRPGDVGQQPARIPKRFPEKRFQRRRAPRPRPRSRNPEMVRPSSEPVSSTPASTGTVGRVGRIAGDPCHGIGEVLANQAKLQIGQTNRRRRHVHSVPSIKPIQQALSSGFATLIAIGGHAAMRRPYRLSKNHRRAFCAHLES